MLSSLHPKISSATTSTKPTQVIRYSSLIHLYSKKICPRVYETGWKKSPPLTPTNPHKNPDTYLPSTFPTHTTTSNIGMPHPQHNNPHRDDGMPMLLTPLSSTNVGEESSVFSPTLSYTQVVFFRQPLCIPPSHYTLALQWVLVCVRAVFFSAVNAHSVLIRAFPCPQTPLR